MIRHLAILSIVATSALFPPLPALADEVVEWTAHFPKQGTSGFLRCVGTATAAGTTYVNVNWVEDDANDVNGPVDTCNRNAREDVAKFFRYARGVEISPDSVQVTYERIP